MTRATKTPVHRSTMRRVPSRVTPELDAYGARVVANQNADGWLRLCKLLEKAAHDPRVSAAPHAGEFAELVFDLAVGASASGSAYEAIQPIIKAALEASNRERTKPARDAKGSPAEIRRLALKDVARLTGWDGINTVTLRELTDILRTLKGNYPEYKQCTRRVLSEDAVSVGLRPGKKSRSRH